MKSFYKLRPDHIKLQHAIKYRGCLCEYCTNIELKGSAINKLGHNYKMKSFFQGVYEVSRMTLCPKGSSKHYKRKCVERNCNQCGTHNIHQSLAELASKHGDQKMSWKKWEKVSEIVDGKTIKKQVIQTKEGTLSECIAELELEATNIAKHLFNASWQNEQFSAISHNIPDGWVTMVLDFGENYVCKYQDEIQSAHWYHTNATIHPIVCCYNCPQCNHPMEESLIFITPDKLHDYHAVHHFRTQAIIHLANKTKIKRIICFSDGAASQYKSKSPFLDVAVAEKEYGIQLEHHFYGSRHGKGPSDGETAVVKRQVSMAVTAGTAVVNNAKELYNYCAQNITKKPQDTQISAQKCLHFQREVFYVESVIRQRGHEEVDLRTIKGTRLIHSLKGNQGGILKTRNLSCFCISCVSGGLCRNTAHVDEWKDDVLFTKPPKIQSHAGLSYRKIPSNSQHIHNRCQDDHDVPQTDAGSKGSQGGESELQKSGEAAIAVHNFVAVRLGVNNAGGKKPKTDKMFVAKVASILEDNQVGLSYMLEQQQNLYTWPSGEEQVFVHPAEDIVAKLDEPKITWVGSRMYSVFNLSDAQRHFLFPEP